MKQLTFLVVLMAALFGILAACDSPPQQMETVDKIETVYSSPVQVCETNCDGQLTFTIQPRDAHNCNCLRVDINYWADGQLQTGSMTGANPTFTTPAYPNLCTEGVRMSAGFDCHENSCIAFYLKIDYESCGNSSSNLIGICHDVESGGYLSYIPIGKVEACPQTGKCKFSPQTIYNLIPCPQDCGLPVTCI